jgi:hypothetical protein
MLEPELAAAETAVAAARARLADAHRDLAAAEDRLRHVRALVAAERGEAAAPGPPPAPPGSPPGRPPESSATPPRSARRPVSAAGLLLTTGAVLVLSAAAVFVALTWTRLGVTGQAAVLAGVTLIAGVATVTTRGRRLHGTAEALAGVTAGLLVLDAVGARTFDLAGLAATPLDGYVTLAAAAVTLAAGAAAVASARRGRLLSVAAAAAAIGVTVTAVAGVAWVARLGRDHLLPPLDPTASIVSAIAVPLVGVVDGLVVVGLAALGLSLVTRRVPGLTAPRRTAGVVAAALLAGAAVAALLVALLEIAGDALPPDIEAVALAHLAVAGVVGPALALAPAAVRPAAGRVLAAVAGFAVLACVLAVPVATWGRREDLLDLAPVVPVALLTAVAAVRRVPGVWRTGAAVVVVAAGVLHLWVVAVLVVGRIGTLGGGVGLGVERGDSRALGVAVAVIAAASALLTEPPLVRVPGRIRTALVGTVAAAALPTALWAGLPVSRPVVAVVSLAVAGAVAMAGAVGSRRTATRWWVAVAVAGSASWWLHGLAAASVDGSGAAGGFLAVTAVVALAVAGVLTPGLPRRPAPRGVQVMVGAALAVGALGAGLLPEQAIGGALAALAAAALGAVGLPAVASWSPTRVVPPALGAVGLVVLLAAGLDGPGPGPLERAAAAGLLLAQAVAGLVEVRGRRALRPHALRHVAVPGLAAWLATDLVLVAEPRVAATWLDETALRPLAVLLVGAGYGTWVVRRSSRYPLGDRARLVVRDALVPVLLSAAGVVALAALRPGTGWSPAVDGLLVAAAGLAVHLGRLLRGWRSAGVGQHVRLRDLVAAGSAALLGTYGVFTGDAPSWVAGATFAVGGVWGLAVAILVRGPLAGPWPGAGTGRGWLAVRLGTALAVIGYLRIVSDVDGLAVEALSVPVGVVLTGFGLAAMLSPRVAGAAGSMRSLLPGLLIALGPSTWLAVASPEGWRPLVVATVGTALAIAGGLLRWQAPLAVGAAAAICVAVVQALPLAEQLPEWVWLAAAGAVALALGATFEAQRERARRAGRAWRALR